MPSSGRHDHHFLRILDAVEAGRTVTQRSLAHDLGIAVGLANLLIKHLVRKGWVRVTHIKPNRVRYLITPAGITEKAKMTRDYFEANVDFYRQTRERVRERFMCLSTMWNADGADGGAKRVVFYGAGEVAEIGYICLVETDLQLVGVVDPAAVRMFFGMKVHRPDQVAGLTIGGQPFDRLVVMSFGDEQVLDKEVAALRLPPERVFFL